MKAIIRVAFVLVFLAAIFAVTASANGALEIFHNEATFLSETGADLVPFPASADTALPHKPFASSLLDYSCIDKNVGITLGSNDVTVKAPAANAWICFIGPGWNAGLANTNPTPVSPTIVANAEDDYHVVEFENPVYAVGFKLLTNSAADETIALTYSDDTTEILDDTQLDTAPNSLEFVGFRSSKPITSVSIDTSNGAVQNEGIVSIWVNDEAMTRDISDCTHQEYAGFSHVETLFVSANGIGPNTPIESSMSLVSGWPYMIEASGVYYAGGLTTFDIRADAEYSQDAYERAHDLPWGDLVHTYEGYGEGLLELMIDGGILEWGPFTADHIYTQEWEGSGDPLTFEFQINDIYAQNNTGGLCVSIFERNNEPPVADPNGPYLGAVNEAISLDGTGSSDPDGDALGFSWDFGDSNTGTGSTPTHSYTAAGIYDACLTVNDGYEESASVCTIAVVFDPSGGFVTGGGWFYSEPGWYQPDPSLGGKATFGFVAKYKKGANVPDGNTEFQFKAGDLNFHSTSYEWLVVAGNKAQFKGEGTINGAGSYKFMIWADDDDPDTFRIQIWGDTGTIYDNGSQQALGGGSIVVHSK